MEGLLSFLIFAGLFYFMMRFGCGAHMLHGHSKETSDHIDPVCHMKVDPKQGYGMMHNGSLFRFCSRNCLDKFEKEPEKYLAHQKKEDES